MTPATVLLASLLTVFGGPPDAGVQQPAPPTPPEAPRPPHPPRPPRPPRDSRSRHEATDRQVHKLSIGRTGSLDLSNISGDVVVDAGSGDETVVEVVLRGFGDSEEEAKRQLELIYVDVIKGAQRAEVRAKYRDRFGGSGRRNLHSSADYRVTAPSEVRVTVHSVSGDVQATKMKGELSIETVSGDVALDSASRVTAAKSVSGDVSLTGISSAGTLAASSVSGDVTARGLKADRLELTSVSGSVSLRDVACDGAEITSTSGDIDFAGALSKNGRYEMQSHSGTIRVELSGNTGFEVEATSFSGEVRSDVPLDRQSDPDDEGSSRRGPRRRSLRGTYGDGSAILELTTFSGNIIITSAGRRP